MSEVKLKSCPFCGGKAEVEYQDDERWNPVSYIGVCQKCGCRVERWSKDKEGAAKVWNERKAETPKKAVLA